VARAQIEGEYVREADIVEELAKHKTPTIRCAIDDVTAPLLSSPLSSPSLAARQPLACRLSGEHPLARVRLRASTALRVPRAHGPAARGPVGALLQARHDVVTPRMTVLITRQGIPHCNLCYDDSIAAKQVEEGKRNRAFSREGRALQVPGHYATVRAALEKSFWLTFFDDAAERGWCACRLSSHPLTSRVMRAHVNTPTARTCNAVPCAKP
jgi:hypothetical protein